MINPTREHFEIINDESIAIGKSISAVMANVLEESKHELPDMMYLVSHALAYAVAEVAGVWGSQYRDIEVFEKFINLTKEMIDAEAKTNRHAVGIFAELGKRDYEPSDLIAAVEKYAIDNGLDINSEAMEAAKAAIVANHEKEAADV